ncbi:MAG: hypothetical protein CSA11_00505 [Chloroflexi bacterium]|nr:MAG: hypothetical protein CSA11_00505 [Chloroflexota bacterium]
MSQADFLETFVNKEVTFRFMRQDLRFNLSQSLFSSADVDIGSRFLLRTLAQHTEVTAVHSALDIGCGVGVLGLSLKKINPGMKLVAQDRDALATAFTKQNAALNELEDVVVHGSLAFHNLDGQKFDLILSNLPGKAGHAVLQSMLAQMPAYLSESGFAAVVIVKPLAERVAQTLAEMGCEILFQDVASGYNVFHFKRGSLDAAAVPEEDETLLLPYLRHRQRFKMGKSSILMQTAWNIPEFDSLTHDTTLAINALKHKRVTGRVLFWNPRQGHLPVFVREQVDSFVLAGRDCLSLQISGFNLAQHQVAETAVTSQHLPHFLETAGEYDWIILFPDDDPGVAWEKYLLPSCKERLTSGGQLLMVAKSAYMHRLLHQKRGLHTKFDRRRNGYRAVILMKR